MKAQGWNEVESIELTDWTKNVSQHVRSLPSAAIHGASEKEIQEILLGVSDLRHSAVHRQPTSAPGISCMLSSALAFANALGCYDRAEKIANLKAELETCVADIREHHDLLQHRLSVQLEDIARQRAEIAQREQSVIEEALGVDKNQRAEAGVILEGFFSGWHLDTISRASHEKRSWDEANSGSITENNIDVVLHGMITPWLLA